MFLQVRTATADIQIGGQSFASALAPYLLSLEYVDSCDGEKADDLQFSLADRDRKFINAWMPDIGTTFDVFIHAERWFSPIGPRLNLDCGSFWIDTVEFELPQHTVTVKASSIPTGVRLKSINETRGWANSSLQKIAGQICDENPPLKLDWQAGNDVKYPAVEQTEESALQFLRKRCDDAKLALKVHRNKLVIFDEAKLEQAAAKFSLIYGDGTSAAGSPLGSFTGLLAGGASAAAGLPIYRMSGGTFHYNVADGIKSAQVRQTKLSTGLTSKGKWTDADFAKPGDVGNVVDPRVYLPPEGAPPISVQPPMAIPDDVEDKVNENTDSDEGDGEGDGEGGGGDTREDSGEVANWTNDTVTSQTKAKAHMRKRNKDSKSAEIEMSIGNPLIASGMTFNLIGVGQYDGKWLVVSAEHKVGPIYETKLKIRRCLEGY
jgi:phage protein D